MKLYNYSVVLSLLSLLINHYLPSESMYLLGFLIILTFGVLHGANDIVIINKSFKQLKNKKLVFVISFYLTIVLVSATLFVFVPVLALLLFVIISAYHFGEQHWNSILVYSNRYIKVLFELIYGCFIFCLIFYFHLEEVERIIESICNYYIDLSRMWLLLTISGVLMVILSLYLLTNNKLFKIQLSEQMLYILVLAIVFKVSGLIWSFAVYFVLWHSIPSLNDQITYLYGKVNRDTITEYIKKAFVYWLASIIGLMALLFLFKDYKVFEALLFSFIAAITFPHVIVIYKMFNVKD